nr:HNH endonuclease [Brucella intermedia]
MPGCGKPASVVDHIQPHRGNKELFWWRGNWQSLCQPCHDRHKQRQERNLCT